MCRERTVCGFAALRRVAAGLIVIICSGIAVCGDIVDTMLGDASSPFYVDVANYPRQRNALPVGVFDSGTGGLTVLDAIVRLDAYDNQTHRLKTGGDGRPDFQTEYFIYSGDKANMPYGTYPEEGKTDLLREHIMKDVQFLLGRRYHHSGSDGASRTDKPPVKAIVIACNTATAYGKADVERLLARAGLDIRVIGVIDAGAAAALAPVERDEDAAVAVMATAGTVASEGYPRALRAQMGRNGYRGRIAIFQQAGIGLAGAIDGAREYIEPGAAAPRASYRGPGEGRAEARIDLSIWPRYGFDCKDGAMLFEGGTGGRHNVQINSVDNYIAYHLTTLLEQVRDTAGAGKLKVIILGCTHYPLYAEAFRTRLARLYDYRENGEYVYRAYMDRRIELVDPATIVAHELYRILAENGLFNEASLYDSRFFVSVPNAQNPNVVVDAAGDFTYAYKYGRTAGEMQEYVRWVPFHRGIPEPELAGTLATQMPLVWAIMRADARR